MKEKLIINTNLLRKESEFRYKGVKTLKHLENRIVSIRNM